MACSRRASVVTMRLWRRPTVFTASLAMATSRVVTGSCVSIVTIRLWPTTGCIVCTAMFKFYWIFIIQRSGFRAYVLLPTGSSVWHPSPLPMVYHLTTPISSNCVGHNIDQSHLMHPEPIILTPTTSNCRPVCWRPPWKLFMLSRWHPPIIVLFEPSLYIGK